MEAKLTVFNIGSIIFICLLSTMLHEIAHGATALWQGDHTARLEGRLSLNPLKHIDPMMSVIVPVMLGLLGMPIFGGAKPVRVNKRNLKHDEVSFALVAIAGPLTNILLALLGCIVGLAVGAYDVVNGHIYYLDDCNVFLMTFIHSWVSANIGFAVFNMLPIPPLDGSRVFHAIAPDMIRDFLDRIERYGLAIVYGFIFIGGVSGYMLIATDFVMSGFGRLLDLFF